MCRGVGIPQLFPVGSGCFSTGAGEECEEAIPGAKTGKPAFPAIGDFSGDPFPVIREPDLKPAVAVMTFQHRAQHDLLPFRMNEIDHPDQFQFAGALGDVEKFPGGVIGLMKDGGDQGDIFDVERFHFADLLFCPRGCVNFPSGVEAERHASLKWNIHDHSPVEYS